MVSAVPRGNPFPELASEMAGEWGCCCDRCLRRLHDCFDLLDMKRRGLGYGTDGILLKQFYQFLQTPYDPLGQLPSRASPSTSDGHGKNCMYA